MVMSVNLGCCHNKKASTLISATGSRTTTDTALFRMFCNATVSLMTREMSWPEEFLL